MSFMGRINSQMQQFGIGKKENGPSQYSQPQGYPYPQPQQYAQPQQYYQQPPPQQNYGYSVPNTAAPATQPIAPVSPEPAPTPLPTYQTVPQPNQPTLPSGWTTLFDSQQQKWYYVEQKTCRTQWEVPTAESVPPPAAPAPPAGPVDSQVTKGIDGPPNYDNAAGAWQSPAPYPPPGQAGYPPAPGLAQPYPETADTKAAAGKEKKGMSGKNGMLLGAAGGVAAGVAGAALVNKVQNKKHNQESYYDGYAQGHAEGHEDYDSD